VFTEPLFRNGLHKPVIPQLFGPVEIENTASSIGASWTVFTELLPGNGLIKSVTIYNNFKLYISIFLKFLKTDYIKDYQLSD
jgi:hypothetical protein